MWFIKYYYSYVKIAKNFYRWRSIDDLRPQHLVIANRVKLAITNHDLENLKINVGTVH